MSQEESQTKEEKSGKRCSHLTYVSTFEQEELEAAHAAGETPPTFLKGTGDFKIRRMQQRYFVDFADPLGALLAVGQIIKEDPSAVCSLLVCPETSDEAEAAQAQEPEAPPATKPERPASVPPPEAPVGTAQPENANAA